ncbi:hypothetical protein SAMN06265365_11081 [Tistlia consotensis]|uniref:Relaxase/Mobilisation nuclease domain-containing protein n=1 Tax=Tistlia consotensis USBA 355 TaxID=560819 RepID=A0A1Y6BSU3_9PROT|nr:hypothetical protein [Tistlia consotensis]SMF27307.1 hypothetical protein SAMN05428998_10975 [Tistlia consotensis USBA 355]SNR66268.1 hypothetical protein SAMN06265365_11081 [Tistlia consotensis]
MDRQAFARAAVAARADRALGRAGGPALPAIVKAVSKASDGEGLRRLVRYVARLDGGAGARRDGGDEAPAIFLGSEQVSGREALDVAAGWEEPPRAQRGRPPALARHLVVSVPQEEGPAARSAFERSIQGLVDETFEAWGHPTFWVLHLEHGRHPHAHLVVRNRSSLTGRALACDRLLLDGLRLELARQAEAAGLVEGLDASRRVDRPELTSRASEQAVRDTPTWQLRRARRRREDTLVREAPDYAARFGRDFVARAEAPDDAGPRRAVTPAAGGDERGSGVLVDEVGRLFDRLDALRIWRRRAAAEQRFRSLWPEVPALAEWSLRHRPGLFGACAPDATARLRTDAATAELLRRLKPLRPPGRGWVSTQLPPARSRRAPMTDPRAGGRTQGGGLDLGAERVPLWSRPPSREEAIRGLRELARHLARLLPGRAEDVEQLTAEALRLEQAQADRSLQRQRPTSVGRQSGEVEPPSGRRPRNR